MYTLKLHKGDDKNPVKNAFKVKFSEAGIGKVLFSRKNLDDMDFASWSDPKNLQLKLVVKSGSWDTINSAYSPMGNNTISPQSILKGNKVIIDLSMINHRAGERVQHHNKTIGYVIDNRLEKKVATGVDKVSAKYILVIHNADKVTKSLPIPSRFPQSGWKVLADGDNASVKGLETNMVKVTKGVVTIEKNSSAILILP